MARICNILRGRTGTWWYRSSIRLVRKKGGKGLLVRHEDLPAADDGCKGDRLVLLPVLHSLSRVDEDDEVVTLALVVDLALGFVSARHCGWVLCGL